LPTYIIMCELFFVWGMMELEYRCQVRENIEEELKEKGWSEEEIKNYLF